MPANLPSQSGRFAQASDGSDIIINTQELSTVLGGGGGGSTLPLVLPFSTSVNLTQMQVVYANHNITGPLTLSVAAGALPGCSALYTFTADGNNANVPTFPTPAFRQLTGSAGWVNTAGTVNVVSITYLDGTAYYSVSQVVADVVAPPALDPNVENFILMTRRSTNVTLSGTTYTANATAGFFATHGQSDMKLAGDGYVRVGAGVVNAGRPIWGLSSAANAANSYVNWLYAFARNVERNYCDYYYNGTYVNSFFMPVDADARMIRTAGSVSIQTKTAAATVWTNHATYTVAQNFVGNLYFNASWGEPNAGANCMLENPRMFGAS